MILAVEKTAIIVGKEYAFRERRIIGLPFHRVRVLQHIRGDKWKAQWVEPNPGLLTFWTWLVVDGQQQHRHLTYDGADLRL